MKKRGFTLIELIAVVAILMIVFLVASPVLKTLIQNNGKTEKELIEERVLVAAKEYANNYSSNFYDNLVKDGDYNYIYKSDLLSSGLIDSDDMSKLPNLLGVKGEVYNKDKVRYTLQYIDNSDTEYSNEELYLMLNALTSRVTNVEENMREGTNATAVAAQLHDLIDKNSVDNIFLKTYPIGSVYTSIDNTNPGSIFGGTWVSFGTGKTLVGVDTNDTSFNEVEKTGGEKTHTLTVNEMPSHTHDVTTVASTSGATGGGGSHTHGVSNTSASRTTSSNGAHTHSLNRWALEIDSGTSAVFAPVEPNYGHNNAAATLSAGEHTHTVTDYYANTTSSGTTLTVNQIPSHTHTIPALSGTAASTGGGEAHNNLQPYITVYMWKRTA